MRQEIILLGGFELLCVCEGKYIYIGKYLINKRGICEFTAVMYKKYPQLLLRFGFSKITTR